MRYPHRFSARLCCCPALFLAACGTAVFLAAAKPSVQEAPLELPGAQAHADKTVRYESAERFAAVVQAAGNNCRLFGYEGKDHGFYRKQEAMYVAVMSEVDAFLAGLGWITGLFETTTVWPVSPKNRPNYRIPALLVAPNGDVLAFAEKRVDGPGDLGDHDLVMKRSRDLGKTWEPDVMLVDDGRNTSTDPTLLIDARRGVIWLFYLRDKVQYYCIHSADSGRTWTAPRSIHAAVTRPEWDRLGQDAPKRPTGKKAYRSEFWNENWMQRYGVGPGWAGIQLQHGPHAGRLLVPARHIEPVDGAHRTFSHVFYSDDHGDSWHLGPNAVPDGNECRLIELADGRVMIHARDGDNRRRPDKIRRLAAVSRDGGESWEPADVDSKLRCPQCHASIRRFSTAGEQDRNRILFSNPNNGYRTEKHPYGRVNLSVRISYDEAQTWSAGKTIYPFASSYSDLAVLPDGTIGLIYERGPEGSTHYWDEIQFARFDLAWLTDGQDRLGAEKKQ